MEGIAEIKQEYKLINNDACEKIDERSTKDTFNKRKRNRRNFCLNVKKPCYKFINNNGDCPYGELCKFSHDIDSCLEIQEKKKEQICVFFEKYGACPYQITCQFTHPDDKEVTNPQNVAEPPCELNNNRKFSDTLNYISGEVLQALRKKTYEYPKSEAYLKKLELLKGENLEEISEPPLERHCLNFSFKNKLYLAPLTTVGNIPFRRICKEFGADITCSEMVLATSLLQGKISEWALIKRHPSEDIFGVQLAGAFPDTITKAVELITNHSKVDFIDLNMGCPIDLLFNKGAGCALMTNMNKIKKIVRGMLEVSNIPVTIKMRTGIKNSQSISHKILPILEDIGVSAVTIHGRSREQRYTKLADWKYIDECSKVVKSLDVLGNGDILSYEDLDERRTETISSCMIGRGALIKPWIFTEIRERRIWDISSRERFDILKNYTNYGLENWGTDIKGVEKTRNFLLEWLSFLWRYVPVGILEHPPQKMNQRPQPYVARDDLEILLSSEKTKDWIKICEMLLGPVIEGFEFVPKHKSNAYG